MKLSPLSLGYIVWACAAVTGLFLTLVLIPEFAKTLI